MAVILAIGICTAVMEARAKRMARKNGSTNAENEQHPAKETPKIQDK